MMAMAGHMVFHGDISCASPSCRGQDPVVVDRRTGVGELDATPRVQSLNDLQSLGLQVSRFLSVLQHDDQVQFAAIGAQAGRHKYASITWASQSRIAHE